MPKRLPLQAATSRVVDDGTAQYYLWNYLHDNSNNAQFLHPPIHLIGVGTLRTSLRKACLPDSVRAWPAESEGGQRQYANGAKPRTKVQQRLEQGIFKRSSKTWKFRACIICGAEGFEGKFRRFTEDAYRKALQRGTLDST
ncbi:2594_t:CDS:2 [Paraglomus occultum]|uniref:2594_t:CDS:1 n=1 Tax=Paraglomus occultum TaxID=144539 RepID=A0A9N8ZFP5_9GLOM|nr:2594_t:CDS:2 [Paraglomus occultum]